MNPTIIPPEEWSRDHWSLLAYAFTCLGTGGTLDRARMRCEENPRATRTRSGSVPGHTDLDCLVDLERMGLLVNEGTHAAPVVIFTEMGLLVGQWLCLAKCRGQVRFGELRWEDALSLARAFNEQVVARSEPWRVRKRGRESLNGVALRRGSLDSPRTAGERIAAKAYAGPHREDDR